MLILLIYCKADIEYKDLVTYLRLPHLQIYNNFELSFEIFLVPQYPIFAAINNTIKISVIIMILSLSAVRFNFKDI